MAFKYFFHNSQLLPIEQAVIPLSSIEYSYGYGVYESIRVSKGTIFFLEEHARRLINSARIIQLEHSLNEEQVAGSVQKLVKANEASSCNVKILLIGGDSKDSANFYIQCLNPLFPTKELQREGTRCITYRYERAWPGAKTLNMLPSYLAYRQAKAASAYDALLVDSQDCLREGTRTNLLAFQGNTLISPPANKILPGVMRTHVLEIAASHGFKLVEEDIRLEDLENYDSFFLTSSGAKILPINSIDDQSFSVNSEPLQKLSRLFNQYLEAHQN